MQLLSRLSEPDACYTISKSEWMYVFNMMPEGTKFRIMKDDDYWYYNLPPTMLGAIYSLVNEEDKPKRRRFSRRKVQVAVKKQTFGFGAALDEPEEQAD